jgi:hypothetical protein
MRKTTAILFLIMLFISSCEENEENNEPEYLYENVVDSTFLCEVTIEDETHIFDEHKEFIGHSIIGQDSVLLYFEFHYENNKDDRQGEFIIQFCKFFAIEDLENKVEIEDEWYFFDCLEQHEFLSIFQKENLQFCKYNLDKERQVSDGISIIFDGYGDTMWKTNYTALYLDIDSVDSFYENANFTVTNLELLDENNIIIECSFNLEIFGWRSVLHRKNFSNGYFKGYLKNPYTNCR